MWKGRREGERRKEMGYRKVETEGKRKTKREGKKERNCHRIDLGDRSLSNHLWLYWSILK